MKNEKYLAPEAEVLEIAVEQGFAGSTGGNGSGGSGGGEDVGGGSTGEDW